MKHVEIYDDFLPQDYFDHLDTQILHKNQFRWLFQEKVATNDDDPDDEQFYFICSFFNNLHVEDNFFYQLQPIFDALEVKSMIRARAIIYMNTCNGYTGIVNDNWKSGDDMVFDQGNRVESVANRLMIHDGSVPHYSTTCTDTRKRLVLAINYF